MSTIPFANFTKGEISPELQARIDTSQYAAGAKRIRNFIIQRYGGLSFRPGFRLVAEVDDITENLRYIPFQYNLEQAYIMAIGNERMRLLAGGGMIAEDRLNITAITNAVNAQVTAAYHDYVVGDRLHFTDIVGMEELNGRTAKVVSVIDADNFTIDIDTTSYGAFVSTTGITRVGTPTPPAPPPAPPTPPPAPPPEPDIAGGGGAGAEIGGDGGGFDGYYVPRTVSV